MERDAHRNADAINAEIYSIVQYDTKNNQMIKKQLNAIVKNRNAQISTATVL